MIARRTVLAGGLALAAGPALAQGGTRIFAAASLQTALTRIAAGYRGPGAPPNFGLGLWVAKRNMEAVGGSIEASNRRGGGFIVSLGLPLA